MDELLYLMKYMGKGAKPGEVLLLLNAHEAALTLIDHFFDVYADDGYIDEESCDALAVDLSSVWAMCIRPLMQANECRLLMDIAATLAQTFSEYDNLDEFTLFDTVTGYCGNIWRFVSENSDDAVLAKRAARYATAVASWDPWDEPLFLNEEE